jgi:hypothetical protein
LTNDPQVLGISLVSDNEASPTLMNNDSSTPCSDILTEVMDNSERSLKRTRIRTLRSFLISHMSIDSDEDIIHELTSCITYVSTYFNNRKIKFTKPNQRLFIKNVNANYSFVVTVCDMNNNTKNYTIFPTDYTQISTDENGTLISEYLSVDCLYPIGSIIYTNVSDNPGLKLGGQWDSVVNKDDTRFLYSVASTSQSLATGGSSTVALSANQLPSHTHNLNGSGHTHQWYQFSDYCEPETGKRGSYSSERRYMYRSTVDRSSLDVQLTNTNDSIGNLVDKRDTGFWNSQGDLTSGYHSADTGSSGSGSAHENTPQYCKAYCWKRTG